MATLLPAPNSVTKSHPKKQSSSKKRKFQPDQPSRPNTHHPQPNTGPPASSNPSIPLYKRPRSLPQQTTSLPITSHRAAILQALSTHPVLVLSGETGSGKSTQIPQFLLSAPWMRGAPAKYSTSTNATKNRDAGPLPMIAVTQPRRVAAVSLARRVATEMGSELPGSRSGMVGYSVRFDERVGPGTRVKFLTEGMLLREMLGSGGKDGKKEGGKGEGMVGLERYGCVVVDEVHERSVNVDLILGFLRQAIWSGGRKVPLRVVVMSATADVEGIARFFEGEERRLEGKEMNGDISKVAKAQIEGRQYPVTLHYLDRSTDDIVDAALTRIFQIHCKEPMPGDILVFLTGQETIQGLQKLVEEFSQNLGREFPKILVLPLFAALPQAQQQLIFEPAPVNTRKIILSTNIAETSITVPGVRFVIDTGKAKIKQFRNRLGLDSLLVKPISRSSADQRKGRAGREAPGQCHRLYTESAYKTLDTDTQPEILRCDLSAAVLTMKARGVEDVLGFPFLTPPPREALQRSLLQLLDLGCLDDDGSINEIGRQVARLPLAPQLGRVLLEAAKSEQDCLAEVIDIVACLSVENIFLSAETEEARERAHEARSQLFNRLGDHLTLLTAVRSYAGEQTDRKRWSADHLISHRAMQNVMDVRRQLLAMCKHLGEEGITIRETIDEDVQERVLKCFLRGFKNNIARLCPDKSYKTFAGNQTVTIHPSSVLFGRKVEAVMYNEYVYTNKAYARGVSIIQLSWLDELLRGE